MGIASALLLIDDSHANPRGWVGRWGGLWGGKKSHDHNIVWKKTKNEMHNNKYGKQTYFT